MATAKSKMNRTKIIALLGLMLSLTVIFCFVPIQFGPITLALMILPTIIVAQVCNGWTSFAMGLIMGLLNLIAWYTTKAASPIAPIFQNPLICVLPRVLIAVVAFWTRKGLEVLILKKAMKIDLNPQTVVEDDEDTVDEDIEVVEVSTLKNGNNTDENAENTVESVNIDAKNGFYANIEEYNTFVECAKNDDEATLSEEEIKNIEKSKKAKEILARQGIHLVSTALGVITNTLFVAIFTLIFFNNTSLGGTIINVEYIRAWFGLNFAIEVVAFSLITPPITLAIKSAKLV